MNFLPFAIWNFNPIFKKFICFYSIRTITNPQNAIINTFVLLHINFFDSIVHTILWKNYRNMIYRKDFFYYFLYAYCKGRSKSEFNLIKKINILNIFICKIIVIKPNQRLHLTTSLWSNFGSFDCYSSFVHLLSYWSIMSAAGEPQNVRWHNETPEYFRNRSWGEALEHKKTRWKIIM